ncbi:efflux RND transporter periplasmic adaptor subunit [Poriferisphaera sp. WC338]|uniref:efflux RND transporter periplasmic adaptor subunit n=1 Tax=Poriferisphaera sp. WC338 TaxID=3425129 RepID=UPI003D818F76
MKTIIVKNQYKNSVAMLLCFTVLCFSQVLMAQAVDPHAGHNHAEDDLAEKPTSAQIDPHAEHNHANKASAENTGLIDKSQVDPHAGHNDDHEDEGITLDGQQLISFGISTKQARFGELSQIIRLPGEIVFNQDFLAEIHPVVPGIAQSVAVSVGDKVKAGQTLAVLQSRELAEARSQYLASKARFDLQQETLRRDESLFEQKLMAARTLMVKKQAVREAEIELQLADQQLHAFGYTHKQILKTSMLDDGELTQYALRSPIDGVVIQRTMTRGEVFGPDAAEAPFIVANTDSVWADLVIYQKDLPRLHKGMPVDIEFGHDIPSASGTIAFISPAIDEATRTAKARVILNNKQNYWRPGLFVTAYIHEATTKGKLIVPLSAVQQIGDEAVVFVKTIIGFEPAHVQLGKQNQTHVEILTGLEEGQTYVTSGTFTLKAQMQKGDFGDGHNH